MPSSRQHRGRRAHLSGLAAEQAVCRHYQERGFTVLHKRWRGKAGEIDAIVRAGAQVVFVEVKQSQSHAEAAVHLSERQQTRIYQTAEEFLARFSALADMDLRFDVALVDGQGQIQIVENAFGLG